MCYSCFNHLTVCFSGIVYDDSDEDSEEYDYEDDESSEEDYAPPRNFTGGKWKPSSPVQWGSRTGEREWNVPPASFTGSTTTKHK